MLHTSFGACHEFQDHVIPCRKIPKVLLTATTRHKPDHQGTNKSYRYPRSCLSFKDFWESPQLKETQIGIQLLLLLLLLLFLLGMELKLGLECLIFMFWYFILLTWRWRRFNKRHLSTTGKLTGEGWRRNYCSKNCVWKRFLLEKYSIHERKLYGQSIFIYTYSVIYIYIYNINSCLKNLNHALLQDTAYKLLFLQAFFVALVAGW